VSASISSSTLLNTLSLGQYALAPSHPSLEGKDIVTPKNVLKKKYLKPYKYNYGSIIIPK
jgi:hypothetical protein